MESLKGTAKPAIGHEAIMDFLLLNPTATNAMIASRFGYTREYISALINNDAFQLRFSEKQLEVWGEVKIQAVRTRDMLEALAQSSVEKLQRKLEVHDDPQFLLDTAEMACKSLGYGSKTPSVPPGSVVQQNNFYVSREVLAQARGSFHKTADVVDVPVIASSESPAIEERPAP